MAEAEEALGEKIGALIATGPAEALERTEQAQPAILIISIALLEAARERAAARGETLETPIFAAGHSAGQYAAAVAAGALSIGDAVKLSRRRGELMQTSGSGRPGAMAAILGLPRPKSRASSPKVRRTASSSWRIATLQGRLSSLAKLRRSNTPLPPHPQLAQSAPCDCR